MQTPRQRAPGARPRCASLRSRARLERPGNTPWAPGPAAPFLRLQPGAPGCLHAAEAVSQLQGAKGRAQAAAHGQDAAHGRCSTHQNMHPAQTDRQRVLALNGLTLCVLAVGWALRYNRELWLIRCGAPGRALAGSTAVPCMR